MVGAAEILVVVVLLLVVVFFLVGAAAVEAADVVGAALNFVLCEGTAEAAFGAFTFALLEVLANPPPSPKKSTAGSSVCSVVLSSSTPSSSGPSSPSSLPLDGASFGATAASSPAGGALALPFRAWGSRDVAGVVPVVLWERLGVELVADLGAGNLKPPPRTPEDLFVGSGRRPASPSSLGLFAAGSSLDVDDEDPADVRPAAAAELLSSSLADLVGLGRSRTNFLGPEAAAFDFVFGGGRDARNEEVDGLLDVAATADAVVILDVSVVEEGEGAGTEEG